MQLSSSNPLASTPLARLVGVVSARLNTIWRSQKKRKTLSVCETANLGERRFVAVVQFERQRFLIGASPSSLTLLAQLPDDDAPSVDFRSGGVR